MKNFYLKPTLLAIAVLVGACSTMTSTPLLDQTRSDYQDAQSNPNVTTYATLELKQASDALDKANAAVSKNESAANVDKLAYLAKQKIALAQEVAKRKSAEAQVVNSAKERDQMRLQQRTTEADAAKMNAETSAKAAQAAQAESADAQRSTQAAQARTAQLEAELAALNAKKTERGIIITLGDVLFGTDLARLNSDGMRTLQKLADVLQKDPQRNVLVEGFTDSTGTAAHNLELSDRRANSVKSALLGMGVNQERVAVRGYGEEYPVAANDTAKNRQLNRRVEIVLSDETGKTTPR